MRRRHWCPRRLGSPEDVGRIGRQLTQLGGKGRFRLIADDLRRELPSLHPLWSGADGPERRSWAAVNRDHHVFARHGSHQQATSVVSECTRGDPDHATTAASAVRLPSHRFAGDSVRLRVSDR